MPDALSIWDFAVLLCGVLTGVFIGLIIAARWCRLSRPEKVVNITIDENQKITALGDKIRDAFKEMDE